MSDGIGPIGATTPGGAAANQTLDLGQAVIVSMPKEVLATATSAGKAGRILAEVIAQNGVHATLNTPDGAFIIKSNSALTIGQVVMLRLDPQQVQAQQAITANRTAPADSVSLAPSVDAYAVPLSLQVAAVAAKETLPQHYWRGQLAPVAIPDDPSELLHVLQDVYQPGVPLEPAAFNSGRTVPATTLPPAINEGVAKFFALAQLLRDMEMLPPTLDDRVLFAGVPPETLEDVAAPPSKLVQSLQGFGQTVQGAVKDTLSPLAQQATEQAGNWLKGKLPSGLTQGLMGQLDQFKDALQKGATSVQQTTAPAGPIALSFALPAGSSLLQVWQNALHGNGLPDGQAPFLLLKMLGLQRPGQVTAGAQSGLAQLMEQFKHLQQGDASKAIVPTLVLPGDGQRNPVLFSPYGLLFSNSTTVLSGQAPLLPGTIIFWQALGNPQPVTIAAPLTPLPFWPAAKTMPASVFEWPDLNQMLQNRADPAVAGNWQNQVQSLVPNLLQPDRLGATMLLMLHALSRASVSGWLGSKTVDALHDAGQQDVLAKLVTDFATAAGRVSDPLQADAQRFVLPLVLPEQMAKMVWQVRRDFPEGGERETDLQQRKKNTRTHFTVEVPTATLGDLQMAGTVWRQQLDLNLKTGKPLDAALQSGIRERFQTALEVTGMTGQLVFAV